MKVLVTGATGFVGRSLLQWLLRQPNYDVVGACRSPQQARTSSPEIISVGELSAETDWQAALTNVEVVVHLAARAHVLKEQDADPKTKFQRTNVDGTLALATQALAAGVRRFIFISSIGVNGNFTSGQAFNETSTPAPHADYARSKLEAESRLQDLLNETEMELVIIRPPLVYAGHAPGNFRRLQKLIASNVPLPFAMVKNQRSMIALENLVDFIGCCIQHPLAANELFLISDNADISTAQMARYLAKGMGRKATLLPIPRRFLYWGAKLLGNEGLYIQLCGSLVIDSRKSRTLLGWQPPVSSEDALVTAGHDFKALSNTNS
ncbi:MULTISPECIES: NAD-dependent epimerase/dehydratase family protein [unclassified Pseudomonas]|uniref:NAD-dependent epimerase/dehydratase family protein n=1 Tax=unclassified Pseudomonas TaxID=196821 RepID=UPI000839B0F8|nr:MULTISPECIES: NAD-dependent epimerase/dehydratase family protein [unclassified Pseudomonas]QIH09990.1 NAD-dependent epimerase/dehydratase family protein [Pseudomonas sp. BIOMIG1BAC]